MNRLLQLAHFLLHGKMFHRDWSFSCIRIGNTQASELGELPTIFPEYWERKGTVSITYLQKPDLGFWHAIREFFDFNDGNVEDNLFIWGDGNKKKCKKNNLLHQSASREEVADRIIDYLFENGSLIQY